jgi:hypothetical protein
MDANHTDELEVHHRTYDNLGAELVSDLVVLCHSCHELHHKRYRVPRSDPSSASAPPVTANADSFSKLTGKHRPTKPTGEHGLTGGREKSEKTHKPSLLRRLLAS